MNDPLSPTRLRARRILGPVSTDDIIPGRFKHMFADPRDLAAHVFENKLPGFAQTLRPQDAIWCDSIFGIGSSREQAATSLLAAGVQLIIAPAFGRIFYRNAWNVGLGLIETPYLDGVLEEEADLVIDWEKGTLAYGVGMVPFPAPPRRFLEVMRAGGLLKWTLDRMSVQRVSSAGE